MPEEDSGESHTDTETNSGTRKPKVINQSKLVLDATLHFTPRQLEEAPPTATLSASVAGIRNGWTDGRNEVFVKKPQKSYRQRQMRHVPKRVTHLAALVRDEITTTHRRGQDRRRPS